MAITCSIAIVPLVHRGHEHLGDFQGTGLQRQVAQRLLISTFTWTCICSDAKGPDNASIQGDEFGMSCVAHKS